MSIDYGSVCSGIEAATVNRFMAKVAVRQSGCWEWTGALNSAGYGKFGAGGRRGATLLAHRFSHQVHIGPIPAGMYVCHKCDNRICVNPQHLFIGTPSDNNLDMRTKGRSRGYDRSGQNNPSSKLTAAAVSDIRARASAGERLRDLSRCFGISYGQLCQIVSGKSWKE